MTFNELRTLVSQEINDPGITKVLDALIDIVEDIHDEVRTDVDDLRGDVDNHGARIEDLED